MKISLRLLVGSICLFFATQSLNAQPFPPSGSDPGPDLDWMCASLGNLNPPEPNKKRSFCIGFSPSTNLATLNFLTTISGKGETNSTGFPLPCTNTTIYNFPIPNQYLNQPMGSSQVLTAQLEYETTGRTWTDQVFASGFFRFVGSSTTVNASAGPFARKLGPCP